MKAGKVGLSGLLVLLTSLGIGGCRWASGPGDTVDTPPRALVEKTFRPPQKSNQSGSAPSATSGGNAATGR